MTLAQVVGFGLGVIAEVTKAIIEAHAGKLTPEQVLERIAEATKQDRAVDARVDAELASKFPGG